MAANDQMNGVRTPNIADTSNMQDMTASGSNPPEQASQTAQHAQQAVGQVAQQAQQQASQVAQQVKSGATRQINQQKQAAAQAVDHVAQTTSQFSQHLRQNNQGAVADVVDHAADQMKNVSSYLRSNDLEDILDDARDLARRQPVLFLGGAFLLGALAARFLKSSGSQARRGRSRSSSYSGASRGGQYQYPNANWRPGNYVDEQPMRSQAGGYGYGYDPLRQSYQQRGR